MDKDEELFIVTEVGVFDQLELDDPTIISVDRVKKNKKGKLTGDTNNTDIKLYDE